MAKKLLTVYWCIIIAVQCYLIYYKINNNTFLWWNVFVFCAALLIILGYITQTKRSRPLEILVAVFVVINSISSFFTQIQVQVHPFILYGSIPLAIVSIGAVYLLSSKKEVIS